MMARVVLAVILLFMPIVLQAQIAYDGVILGRANHYDGYPAHLFYGGKHFMWWCSQGSNGFDVIYYAFKNTTLGAGGWSTPQLVFSPTNSPWTTRHTCDPSVIKGNFSYQGGHYSLAMYYTSWRNLDCAPPATCLGGRNAIGVAFSNDGIAWVANPTPVLAGNSTVVTDYGAGQSGVAFDPVTNILQHAYRDTSQNPLFRLNQTSNGVQFTPNPAAPMLLDEAARDGFGQAPDIAWNPADSHWYAVIKDADLSGTSDGETRVLRSRSQGTLLGSWEVIGVFNSTVTGWPQNPNPGLGKNGDGSLYIDAQGWAYAFFSVGNVRPDVASWEIAQARFRPRGGTKFYSVSPCRVLDTRISGDGTFSSLRPSQTLQFSGACGIPAGAKAVATNLTSVPQAGRCDFAFSPGDVTTTPALFPAAGSPRALFSTLTLSRAGEGTLRVAASCPSGAASHLIVDVTGYFKE
jgi:hypothetical protein